MKIHGLLHRLYNYDHVCILNEEISYPELTKSIVHNQYMLNKQSRPESLIVDINLGWRFIPILVAAILSKITVIPVDIKENMEIFTIFNDFPEANVIDGKGVDNLGRIMTDRFVSNFDEELDDVAFLLHTSGSTGSPKAVMLTFENISTNLEDILAYSELGTNDRVCITRPLSNVSAITGEILPALFSGSQIYVKPPIESPLTVPKIINKYNTPIVFTTPTLATILATLKNNKWASPLKRLVLSGECLKQGQLDKILQTFPHCEVWNAYGLTEASPRISVLKESPIHKGIHCVGKPLPHVDVKIVNEKGQSVKEGDNGQLLVKGANIMKGYYRSHRLTSLKKSKDDWLNTGDIASYSNGYLYVYGRSDWMIIRGGENINPMEIEQILSSIPEVQEAMVFAADEDRGTKIHAWVTSRNKIQDYAIFKTLREQNIPSKLWPDKISIVDSLPKSSNGKLLRPRGGA